MPPALPPLKDFLIAHHRKVLALWLAILALALAAIVTHPADRLETELDGAHGTEAHRVMTILESQFGSKLGASADVVVTGQLDGRALERELREAFPAIARIHEIKGLRPHRDRLFHLEFRPDLTLKDAHALVPKLREHLARSGASAQVTGSAAFQHDAKAATKKDSRQGESLSLLISLGVLIATFGALASALLPLAIAASSLLIFHAAIAAFALPANPVSVILAALVGVALAIDYSIFLVSRFREELAAGRTPSEALAVVLAHPRRTILFSALIMAVSLLALLIPDVSLSRTVVLDLLVVLAISLVNALVVVPALLIWRPHWLDRPRALTRLVARLDTSRAWERLAQAVVARPLFAFALAVGLLAAVSAPAFTMRLWEPVQAIAPRDAESMRAYQRLQADGWGGELVPVQILVEARGGAYGPETLGFTQAFTRALEAHPRVAAVHSLTSWRPELSVAERVKLYAAANALAVFGGERPYERLVSADGGWTLVQVYPRDLMSLADTDAILAFARDHARAHPEREVLVGGVVARVKDFTHELYRHTGWIVLAVVGGIVGLLFVYMRSVVLPLKAAAVNFLPICGAFGLLTLVFQHGWGSAWLGTPVNGAVTNIVPVVLFCIVFGLSMDYEVLILSRVTEAHERGLGLREAVVEGLGRSGSVITGAALILIGVFVTGVFSSSPQTQEICLGITAAIVIDATIVRFLLVPSAMVLMGRWNWWNPFAGRPTPGEEAPLREAA